MRFKKNLGLILTAVSLCFFASGCATHNFNRIKEKLDSREVQGCYIKGFKFVKQGKNWCGPAALSSVLQFWGEKTTQEDIAKEIYLPNIKGTLTFDLENYAYNKGYFSQTLQTDIHDLGRKVKSGIPVIVIHRMFPLLRIYHYLVVFGYDDTDELILAYTGKKEATLIPYSFFVKRWRWAGKWMLVVCPPEKVNWKLDAYYANKLGLLYEKKGKLNEAKEYYKQASNLKPDNPTYLYNIGNTYLKEKNYQQAISYFKKTTSLDSKFADAYNNLAYSLSESGGDLDNAEGYIKKAIKLNPDNSVYYLDTLGVIYLKKTQIEKAILCFKAALKLADKRKFSNLSVIYKHLAEAYKIKGDLKKYKKYLDKAKGL